MMKIAFGSDHGGFEYKNAIIKHLEDRGFECLDCGCFDDSSCDYPDYAKKVAASVASGECGLGILVCGTGIGMSICANKVPGIRASVCTNEFMTKATKEHNDANILCLGARVIDEDLAIKLADIFVDTPFSNDERHIRRINKLES